MSERFILVENVAGDIEVFPTLDDVLSHVEAIDVRSSCYWVFATDGTEFALTVDVEDHISARPIAGCPDKEKAEALFTLRAQELMSCGRMEFAELCNTVAHLYGK